MEKFLNECDRLETIFWRDCVIRKDFENFVGLVMFRIFENAKK